MRVSRLAEFVIVTILLTIVAVLPPAAAQSSSSAKPATIKFGYITGIAFPTFIIAEDRGYFAKENLKVEKIFLNGSGPVTEALAAGNVEMGNTTPLSSILGTVKGAKVKMLSAHENSFTDKDGNRWEGAFITVRSGEGIKTLSDFRGKRVAINDIGSSYTYFLRAKLIELGIKPDDVTIIPIPFAQMAGALLQKQVDVMIATADGYLQAKSRAEVDVIGTQTTLENLDVSVTSAFGVNNDYLAKNRDVVVRFLRAILQARTWMREAVAKNDPELLNLVAASMKYSPERAKAFWETRGGYYGRELPNVNLIDLPRRLIDRQVAVFKTAGLIEAGKDVKYETVVDITPLREAYTSLKLNWDESKH